MLPLPNELIMEEGGGIGNIETGEVDLSGGEIRVTMEEGTTSTNSGLTTGGNGSEVVVEVSENLKNEAQTTRVQGVPDYASGSGSGYDNGYGGGTGGENNSFVNSSQQSQVRIDGGLLCVREMGVSGLGS